MSVFPLSPQKEPTNGIGKGLHRVGVLTIQRLRKKAEAELGPKFDIREFHAQLLNTGALPLSILEQKIDRWIAEKK
jgi:uncharacterized protein (DUF885 family)